VGRRSHDVLPRASHAVADFCDDGATRCSVRRRAVAVSAS
jgi:hypothetical protein